MPHELPTGVVTLLFTDVEGSTKLLHELGDAYTEALHEHRRVLRAAFAAHHGVEVDTQGDAFFVAFARASDAAAAAAEGQRSLVAGPIRVRMGIHTGEPRLTEEGYVGLDVHRGARIAAVGHGGQVLLSHATRALVEVDVRDLGPHRLKDLSAPERIYQLVIEGLPSEFPLLKTLEAGITNLPSPRTSFVGRADELEQIDRLLGDPGCRLLTLVGPGGAGKTRLALEAAARRLDRYPHGVHFVPLASITSADFLAPAVADTLQFSVDGAHSGFSAQDQLLDYLSERSTLIVLDNFEHLVTDGSSLLAQLLERAPDVEIMTTSRERLDLQSEWIVDVEGLGGDAGALQLFLERARQVAPGFELGDDRDHAARICRLVDGMPLGIELAASWVSMLPCSEIADEIERNIGFLETSMRDVPERHRSLRAAYEGSWRLLSDEQRRAFERLSVFRGSFTREAATAVAKADLRLLSELQAKSLVRRPELGRYELHELLRQYAAEQLGDAADGRERHARFFVAMLSERREALLDHRMAEARDELRGEVDNLRVAAEWAVQRWDEEEARETLAALATFYTAHSWYEGAETIAHLAGLVDHTTTIGLSALAFETSMASALGYDEQLEQTALECLPALRERGLTRELGSCLLALGTYACYRDEYPAAARYLEEAVAVARSIGDLWVAGASLSWLGFVRLLLDELEASRAAFEASDEVGREMGQPLMRAYARSKLGLLADAEGEYATAMRLHMEANALFDTVGDRGGAGYTLSRASLSAYGLGDYPEAMRLALAGYEAFSEVNHRWGEISALCRMGFASFALGELEDARADFQRALEQAQKAQAVSLLLLALSGIGVVLAREGEERRAAELLSFAQHHPSLPPPYVRAYLLAAQPELDRLEAELPAEELAAAREAAAAADLETLVAEALARKHDP